MTTPWKDIRTAGKSPERIERVAQKVQDELTSLGRVPEGLIPSSTTQAERALLPFAKDGKALFAICYEWYCLKARRWEADIMYCLATNAGDARVQYLRAPVPETSHHMRIVAISAVLGYHVADSHGDVLTADAPTAQAGG